MTLLRQRMIEDMQVRNLAPHTQATYILHVSLFARHFRKSPELLGPEEIRDYQLYLTNQRKLAPSSIIVTTAALRFLYNVTLKRGWNLEASIPAPRQPKKLPVVEPSGGTLFSGLHRRPQRPGDPDDLLRRRLASSEAVRLNTSPPHKQRTVTGWPGQAPRRTSTSCSRPNCSTRYVTIGGLCGRRSGSSLGISADRSPPTPLSMPAERTLSRRSSKPISPHPLRHASAVDLLKRAPICAPSSCFLAIVA